MYRKLSTVRIALSCSNQRNELNHKKYHHIIQHFFDDERLEVKSRNE